MCEFHPHGRSLDGLTNAQAKYLPFLNFSGLRLVPTLCSPPVPTEPHLGPAGCQVITDTDGNKNRRLLFRSGDRSLCSVSVKSALLEAQRARACQWSLLGCPGAWRGGGVTSPPRALGSPRDSRQIPPPLKQRPLRFGIAGEHISALFGITKGSYLKRNGA